jgi:hypothetical protein
MAVKVAEQPLGYLYMKVARLQISLRWELFGNRREFRRPVHTSRVSACALALPVSPRDTCVSVSELHGPLLAREPTRT